MKTSSVALRLLLLSALVVSCSSAQGAKTDLAPAPVRALPLVKGWVLETDASLYVLARNYRGGLQHLYWGGRLNGVDQLTPGHFLATQIPKDVDGGHRGEIRNEEYPAWGGPRFEEPCLKVAFADGARDLVLEYVSDRIQGAVLEVVLKDVRADVFVTLTYRVSPHTGIISKRAKIENRTKQLLTVESAQSGGWNLPADTAYRLTYLTGRWGSEAHVTREVVHQGIKVLESRRGTTGFDFNPWFAVDRRGEATEENGQVWFGALGWSGNWRIAVEQTAAEQVRVTAGYNPFDFAYPLKSGESLETPPYYGGFTDKGFGEMSRMLHAFERAEIAPHGTDARLRPVWYNSWQVFETEVTEANQKELATKAAALGVELFLVDDGWFHLRKGTNAGLGDWWEDRDKFPNGLKPLADHVKSLGMDFGLWIEPEMVNPNSDLYRAHPDWVLEFPGRPRTEGREQLVLNLARNDVKEFMFAALDRLVTQNNIRLFKWDMNRFLTEPGWAEMPVAEQKKVWVLYTQNLYELIDRLRAKHPGLEIESCKGGGGRVDMGILQRVDQFWTSDNTDALDRLQIQEGFSYAYAPKFMMDRVPPPVSRSGYRNVRANTPLEFRFLVAMQGSLGLSLNLPQLTSEETETARRLVGFYKTIRETTQSGNLYRLLSPRESELAANQFVSEDGRQAVVFALLRTREFYSNFTPPVYLRGLVPQAQYRVKPLHETKLVERVEIASGDWLMNHGLHFDFPGADMDGTAVVLERLP